MVVVSSREFRTNMMSYFTESNGDDFIVKTRDHGSFKVSIKLFDYFRYKNRAKELEKKYKDSKANKWFKLWMLFVLMWLMFLLPFLVSALLNVLK